VIGLSSVIAPLEDTMTADSASEDSARLALLVTDLVGDLGISQQDKNLWTPESVCKSIKDDTTGGAVELANILIARLQSSTETTPGKNVKLETWDDFYKNFQALAPPWVSAKDISEKPIISKLEILAFLASSLQNRLLRQTSKDAKASSPSADPVLPAHITREQKDIILECYEGIKEDYQKRRLGMQRRLDILVANFEADNTGDKEILEIKNKLQKLAVSSAGKNESAPLDMDEASLQKHFSTPHSKDIKRHSVEERGNDPPINPVQAENPGGRPNEDGSRVRMPEWSGSKI
jgi:hypothetical protein